MPAVATGVEPGAYERYVFALFWTPRWAMNEACPTGNKPDSFLVSILNSLPPNASALTGLTIHGLWPEYDATHAPLLWPEYCNRPGCHDPSEQDPRCALRPATATAFNTSVLWHSTAFALAWSPGFAAHEWRRHGSCTPSTWDQLQFFDNLHAVYESIEAGAGGAAVRHAAAATPTGTTRAADLRAAFAQQTGFPPVLRCAPQTCDITEVRIGLAAAQPTLRPSAVAGVAIEAIDDDKACNTCDEVRFVRWNGCPPAPSPPPPSAPTPPYPPPSPSMPSPPLTPSPTPSSPPEQGGTAWTWIVWCGAALIAFYALLKWRKRRLRARKYVGFGRDGTPRKRSRQPNEPPSPESIEQSGCSGCSTVSRCGGWTSSGTRSGRVIGGSHSFAPPSAARDYGPAGGDADYGGGDADGGYDGGGGGGYDGGGGGGGYDGGGGGGVDGGGGVELPLELTAEVTIEKMVAEAAADENEIVD